MTAHDRRAQEAVDRGRARRAEERATTVRMGVDRHHAEDRTAAHPEEEEEDEPCGAK